MAARQAATGRCALGTPGLGPDFTTGGATTFDLCQGFFSWGTNECDGTFWASLDAQPASFAGLCINQQCLPPPVSKAFDFSSDA